MSGFRHGRSAAQHFEPERHRGVASAGFARNFAAGPADDTAITGGAGTLVPWSQVDSGAPGTDVAITPKVSGAVRIRAVLTFSSNGESDEAITVFAAVNGVNLPNPAAELTTIIAHGQRVVAIQAQKTGLPLNTPATVQIRASAGGGSVIVVTASSSTLSIEEVPASTG
jgi:hypothetical protein